MTNCGGETDEDEGRTWHVPVPHAQMLPEWTKGHPSELSAIFQVRTNLLYHSLMPECWQNHTDAEGDASVLTVACLNFVPRATPLFFPQEGDPFPSFWLPHRKDLAFDELRGVCCGLQSCSVKCNRATGEVELQRDADSPAEHLLVNSATSEFRCLADLLRRLHCPSCPFANGDVVFGPQLRVGCTLSMPVREGNSTGSNATAFRCGLFGGSVAEFVRSVGDLSVVLRKAHLVDYAGSEMFSALRKTCTQELAELHRSLLSLVSASLLRCKLPHHRDISLEEYEDCDAAMLVTMMGWRVLDQRALDCGGEATTATAASDNHAVSEVATLCCAHCFSLCSVVGGGGDTNSRTRSVGALSQTMPWTVGTSVDALFTAHAAFCGWGGRMGTCSPAIVSSFRSRVADTAAYLRQFKDGMPSGQLTNVVQPLHALAQAKAASLLPQLLQAVSETKAEAQPMSMSRKRPREADDESGGSGVQKQDLVSTPPAMDGEGRAPEGCGLLAAFYRMFTTLPALERRPQQPLDISPLMKKYATFRDCLAGGQVADAAKALQAPAKCVQPNAAAGSSLVCPPQVVSAFFRALNSKHLLLRRQPTGNADETTMAFVASVERSIEDAVQFSKAFAQRQKQHSATPQPNVGNLQPQSPGTKSIAATAAAKVVPPRMQGGLNPQAVPYVPVHVASKAHHSTTQPPHTAVRTGVLQPPLPAARAPNPIVAASVFSVPPQTIPSFGVLATPQCSVLPLPSKHAPSSVLPSPAAVPAPTPVGTGAESVLRRREERFRGSVQPAPPASPPLDARATGQRKLPPPKAGQKQGPPGAAPSKHPPAKGSAPAKSRPPFGSKGPHPHPRQQGSR